MASSSRQIVRALDNRREVLGFKPIFNTMNYKMAGEEDFLLNHHPLILRAQAGAQWAEGKLEGKTIKIALFIIFFKFRIFISFIFNFYFMFTFRCKCSFKICLKTQNDT